jgi:hypothetical protein
MFKISKLVIGKKNINTFLRNMGNLQTLFIFQIFYISRLFTVQSLSSVQSRQAIAHFFPVFKLCYSILLVNNYYKAV